MAHRHIVVVLVCIGLLVVLAGCEGLANTPAPPDPAAAIGGVDLNDPEVGGGVGFPDEGLAPDALPDSSPRLSGTAVAATEAAPAPTELPQPTAAPPTTTPSPVPDIAGDATEPTPLPTAEAAPEEAAEPSESPEEEPEAASNDATDPADEAPNQDTSDADERPTTHIVAPGENLYRIGLQYGVGWLALAQFNGLTNADQITVGQELLIPPATEEDADAPEAETEAPAEEPAETEPEPPAEDTAGDEETAAAPTPPTLTGTPTPSPLTETTHTVAPGENIYQLSQRYGVSWVQIAEANGLVAPNQIFIGQVLKIPVSLPGRAPEFAHSVRPGESIFRIALQYGVPLAALAEANGLQAPYVIYPGQTLLIPSVTEPSP